jgi:hypothetical protein
MVICRILSNNSHLIVQDRVENTNHFYHSCTVCTPAVEVRPEHPRQHALQPFPAPMHAISKQAIPIKDLEAWTIVRVTL